MNQICQRGKLFLGDEGIVLGKENEMLEACVDVRVRTCHPNRIVSSQYVQAVGALLGGGVPM